jgi:hypothetical protein
MRPRRRGEFAGQLARMHVDVLLDLVDDQVVMRSFAAERDVGELAGAVSVGEQYLGGQIRPVVTGEAFHQVQDQPRASICVGTLRREMSIRCSGAGRMTERMVAVGN